MQIADSEPIAQLIDIEHPVAWPCEVKAFLRRHYNLFLDWEIGLRQYSSSDYDEAIDSLREQLQPFALRGWHCTRLTESEIELISNNGMQLPCIEMLRQRIEALVAAGALSSNIAEVLKIKNQAGESNRARMVWFCFFPPCRAGESGIERFFRHWGGEALYNSHEHNPSISPVLSRIGTPCVVEAKVPIASLEPNGGLEFKVVRRFLASQGENITEPMDHEDRVIQPLLARNILRVLRFPEARFLDLTGCRGWRRPISG